MENHEEPQLSPRAQIKRVLRVVSRAIRYWPVMVVAATLALGAALVAPRFVRPVYVSETVLLYEEVIRSRSVVGGDSVDTGLGRNGGRRLCEMLMSRTNLQSIIKELNLYPNTVSSLGMTEAIDELRRNASCEVSRADSFTINFRSSEPELAFAVTERLARSLIAQTAGFRAKQAESTLKFLQAQYDDKQRDLADKEQQLAVFLARHPEFAQNPAVAALTPGASVRANEAARAGKKSAAAAAVRAPANAAVSALQRQAQRIRGQLADDGGGGALVTAPPPLVVDPQTQALIRQAEDEVTRARRRLSEARASKTDNHPDVVSARSRLQAAEANLAALKANAAAPVTAPPTRVKVVLSDSDKQRLRAQLVAINESLEKARAAAAAGDGAAPATNSADGDRIVALETEWTSLTRSVNSARQRSAGLQRLLFSANMLATIESSGEAGRMVISDPPYKPTRPSKRGSRRVGAAAAVLVMLLGAGLAVALAFLDDRVYDAIDLERLRIGKLTHVVPKAGGGARWSVGKGEHGER